MGLGWLEPSSVVPIWLAHIRRTGKHRKWCQMLLTCLALAEDMVTPKSEHSKNAWLQALARRDFKKVLSFSAEASNPKLRVTSSPTDLKPSALKV